MKKIKNPPSLWERQVKKIKRCCALLFACICGTAILAVGQISEKRVTLNLKDAKMAKFIEQVKQQTGFTFFYSAKSLPELEPVTIRKTNAPLEEVLQEIFTAKGFNFILEGTTIVIRKAPVTFKQKIQGIVKDEADLPLPGVTVRLSGTSFGTASDAEGKFTLILAQETGTLEFSCIGFKTIQLKLSKQDYDRPITVRMQEDIKEIEEVVVTGMFTRKANSYTGAVTTIKGEALKAVGNGNILQSLKNIDPSFLQVENLAAGSDPNALPDFQMRGQTGFSEVTSEYRENPNQPLFILDGFEATLTKILDLDMNLVESVTLLKDATAKAIYGAKAANGVVVIETKRPEKGRMKITYTGSVDVEVADLSSYDLCDATEKLEAERRAGFYTSQSGNVKEQIEKDQAYSQMLQKIQAGANTYWLEKPLRVGVGHKHSLYLEGGDEYMLYGVDLSYHKIAGVMKGSDKTMLSGGVTLSYRHKNLLFRNKLTIDDNSSSDSPYGSFDLYAKLNPYNPRYDENGRRINQWVNGTLTEYDYLKNGEINTRFDNKYTTFTENFYIEYQALKNLRLTARFGLMKKNTEDERYKPATHTDFANYTSADQIPLRGSYDIESRKDNEVSGDLGLAYSISKGRHVVFLNAQYTMSRQKFNYYTESAEGLANENMDHISMAIRYHGQKPSGNEGIVRDMGFVVSANYSFDNRYLLDANYRLSGSSDFGADKRWGHFYSFGIGWNLHEESFLKNEEWLNRFKLRASTGYTGSQGFATYTAIPTLDYFPTAYGYKLGAYLLGLANPGLAWQKKYDTNIGADLSFLDGSLNGRIEYYISTTKGTITSVTTPPSTGFNSYTANLGEVENKGWEAYLNWRIWKHSPSASYVTIYASAAANKNTLKKVSDALKAMNDESDKEYDGDSQKTAIPVRYEEGSSMNAIWVVKSLGIDPETGREVFMKKNGSRTFDWNSSDYIVGGDTRPKVSGNFGLNAEYHGIGLNIGFTYRAGGQIYNTTLVEKVENADVHYNVDRRVFTGRWSKSGQAARFKSIADDSYTQPTSRFVEDYNTLTFSTFNVYYDFRECQFLKKSFLQRMKATFYLNDIATISSVKVERGTAYPFARTFSFSIQATF